MGGQLVQLIAHHMEKKGIVKFPHLKYILYGGQVVTRQFKENVKAVFGGKQIVSLKIFDDKVYIICESQNLR